MKFRKMWPVLGALCVAIFADANTQQQYGSHSSSDSMMHAEGSQSDRHGMYERGTYREITPVAGPRVAHGADIFACADFIWWNAVQQEPGYATAGTFKLNTDDPSDPSRVYGLQGRGVRRYVAHDWAPGFKVGLGLNLCHDGWDLGARYIWLRPSNTGKTVFPTSDKPKQPGVVTSEWNLDFNVIDLGLGRNFYLSQYLTMRPFTGFKGTWHKQVFKTKTNLKGREAQSAKSTYFASYPDTGSDNPSFREEMRTWGIGVRGGSDFAWHLSKEWSLYSCLAMTAMWTEYDRVEQTDVVNPKNVDALGRHYLIKNILEAEIGGRWEAWFSDDNYHLALQVGWEEQVWSNWIDRVDDGWADLTLHGLTLKLRFDF
ncbi:MAG: Lpg1974 family pore-forming outer membrane protein [Simkaniaceae bacterium]|nr:Lpg1974 family pore-forming outer membrane protein [Simkaniaceae bacterium]